MSLEVNQGHSGLSHFCIAIGYRVTKDCENMKMNHKYRTTYALHLQLGYLTLSATLLSFDYSALEIKHVAWNAI